MSPHEILGRLHDRGRTYGYTPGLEESIEEIETGAEIAVLPPQTRAPGTGEYVQWSSEGRWDHLQQFCDQQGIDPTSLDAQLNFVWDEMHQNPYAQ